MPHTLTSPTINYDTTQYQYDQVGNQTAVISPRGVRGQTIRPVTNMTY